jgi:transposase-like protein
MSSKQKFTISTEERQRRTFSEEFKRKKVREIEQKITTIAEVSRNYQVRANSVAKWLAKYGNVKMKGVRIIVESESDTRRIQELERKVAELERMVGNKQILLEFQDKMIELAEQRYQVDIKKKCVPTPSAMFGNTGKNSDAV